MNEIPPRGSHKETFAPLSRSLFYLTHTHTVHSQLAAGAPWQGAAAMFRDPAVALFGLAAFGVIMGKHTDKITRSEKKTMPKVLGIDRALKACKLTLIAPHALLLWTFWRERIVGGVAPTVPWGCALAFLTLFREFPAAMVSYAFRLNRIYCAYEIC